MTKPIRESYLECKFREAWAQCGSNLVLVQELPLNANGNSYRVDFAHLPTAYIIELDGLAYHSSREDQRKDRAKRRDLTGKGWHFLEYTSDDLEDNLGGVISEVHQRLNSAESVPVDAFSTSGRAFSVDDLFQALMAQGFHYRESNILRNPASVDFERIQNSAYATRQQTRRASYTSTTSGDYHTTSQRKAERTRLLPGLGLSALAFTLSGFFGPPLGWVFSALATPIEVLSLALLLIGPFIGWFLLIRLAQFLYGRRLALYFYNGFLIILALFFFDAARSSFINEPREIASAIFFGISVIAGLLGFFRYISFWQEHQ